VKHADERIDVRRAGVDVTVSAPKSVSLVFGLAGPHVAEQVRAAHAAAVEQAWSYLQTKASAALRGHHGDGQSAARIATDGPVVAAFDHTTSRAGDPQLHTHLVIPNLVHGADGRWSAMDTRALYRHAATASEIYHATLRGELTLRLGVAWTTPSRGRPEIAGIPRSLLLLFSTRRRQIEAELDRAGQTGPAAAQRACLTTRPPKAHVREGSLRDRWDGQARAAGHDPQRLIASLLGRQRQPAQPDIVALQTELLGPAGVTRHATTFDRDDLLKALCQTIPNGLPVDHRYLEGLAERVLAARDAVPLLTRGDDGQRRYSTAELLASERRALVLAEHLRRQPGAPMDPAVVSATSDSRLSAEQSALLQNLVESGRLTLIVGPAGTGKTAALAAAHRAWQAAGVEVQGTALAAVTARRLADATGIPSYSLARLLADADQHDPATGQPRGLHPAGVVVLDEASIVDTRRLARLFTHAARSGTALVLVGDPRQLPEIEAGGLFTQLARNPSTLHLTDNRRQQQPWERDALARLRAGNIELVIDAYTSQGRIHEVTDPEALRAELVNDYLHARAEAENSYGVAILASSRADVAHLNALVRAALIARGELGATPLHLPADDTGHLVGGNDSLEMRTGDLVIIGRNDNRLGLYNGTRAVVTAINVETGSLTLRTDDERHVTLTSGWAARHDLSHAYAMTLHKAQGLTVDRALLYGSEALTREAGYVGLSRGRRENHIYVSAATRMPGRTGECDFDQPDPLASRRSRSLPSPAGCTPAAATNSRATSNPAVGYAPDRTTKDPEPERKAAADDRAPIPEPARRQDLG
jgi:conjugative relaxase-like TrwC/TraI family protein